MSQSDTDSRLQLTRLILDTRTIWLGSSIEKSASRFMSLLPEHERQPILKKYHVADARMSLASALLKRAYIQKCTGLNWREIKFGRKIDETHGKPCWIPPADSLRSWPFIDFNVSHQNGLVVLVGVCIQQSRPEDEIEISVDIVSPNERNDMEHIASSDFAQFVSTFDYVFSDSEIFNLTYTLPENGSLTLLSGEKIPSSALGRADRAIYLGESHIVDAPSNQLGHGNTHQIGISSELIVESKLRNFYAAFSMKEAYFKLRGEGLTAEWIKECEFNGVRAPEKGGVRRCSLDGTWGESIVQDFRDESELSEGGFEMVLKGERIRDILMELQGFEEDFIICTMLRTKDQDSVCVREFTKWQCVDVEKDLNQWGV